MNTVSSSQWQLPLFSYTNGCRCWSACIRSLGVGPITAPLSFSFITQFVCTLIHGLALPAHSSNMQTQTHTHTDQPADCHHLAFLDIETHARRFTFTWALTNLSTCCSKKTHWHLNGAISHTSFSRHFTSSLSTVLYLCFFFYPHFHSRHFHPSHKHQEDRCAPVMQ